MKTYQIRLTKSSEKSILKISQSLPAIGFKIRGQINVLRTNPHLGLKLQGSDQETRRIRVGDYRIIYEIHENYLLILVIYIGPRGRRLLMKMCRFELLPAGNNWVLKNTRHLEI